MELSAKELYFLHQNPIKHFHFPGEKALIPEDNENKKDLVEKSLRTIRNILAGERVERKNAKSDGEWLPEKKLVKITRHVGNIYPQFGFMNNNVIFLSPEEALFALETNRLNIRWNDVPFSVQQGYILLLETKEEFEKYRAFQELSYLGYRIPNEEFLNKQKSADASPVSKKMKLRHDNFTSNTKNTDKAGDENCVKLFNMIAEGPSTAKLDGDNGSAFGIYRSSTEIKNHTPNYCISIRSNNDSMKCQDASVEDTPCLVSFSGVESVSFYQMEKVLLDNT